MNSYENTVAYKLLNKFNYMRQQVLHYVTALNLCPLPTFITARDGKSVIYVNLAYTEYTGKTLDALQNYKWVKIIYPEDRVQVFKIWKNYIKNLDTTPSLRISYRYINTEKNLILPSTLYATATKTNGIIGYIIPNDCSSLLLLKMDLNCDFQKNKLNTLQNSHNKNKK